LKILKEDTSVRTSKYSKEEYEEYKKSKEYKERMDLLFAKKESIKQGTYRIKRKECPKYSKYSNYDEYKESKEYKDKLNFLFAKREIVNRRLKREDYSNYSSYEEYKESKEYKERMYLLFAKRDKILGVLNSKDAKQAVKKVIKKKDKILAILNKKDDPKAFPRFLEIIRKRIVQSEINKINQKFEKDTIYYVYNKYGDIEWCYTEKVVNKHRGKKIVTEKWRLAIVKRMERLRRRKELLFELVPREVDFCGVKISR